MAKLSLKAAKNRQIGLKTKIQAVKDPTLREQLMEMLNEVNLREAEDVDFKAIEEGLKAAPAMPADSPVPAPEREATPDDLEAAKKNLEGGAAKPAPAPEAPKKRTRGPKTSADRLTFQPNTEGVFAYVRGTRPGKDGKTEVVSIVLNGTDQADLLRVAQDYMKKEGISSGGEVAGQPGVFKNIYVQTIPNPTTGNFNPVDARNLADSHEANYRVARNDALAKVREARRQGKTVEEIKALDDAVPPALMTVSETQAYEAADAARKEARGTRRSQKATKDEAKSAQGRSVELLEKEAKDSQRSVADSFLTRGGAKPYFETTAKGSNQVGFITEDETFISFEQRDRLAERLGLSQAEIDQLTEPEKAALAKMKNQLSNGNFKEALQTASAIPAGSVEKVMRGERPANVPEEARPGVAKDRWSDPPELEQKLKAAGLKSNAKGAKAREIRVRHMFETGMFNVMGDDRTGWIDDNPEGWAKIRGNANAMDYLETVGKNRDIAMTKVTAEAFESGVLVPLNVGIGRMGEPGADVTKNIVTLAERTKSRVFRNGQLKKGFGNVDAQVGKAAAMQDTFTRSRDQDRLAYMENQGWTEASLDKKIGNYREEMSKKQEKGKLDPEAKATYERRIRQAEADKALLAGRRERRAAVEKAALEGGRVPATPYRATRRSFEEQLAAVETKITRLKNGFHPDAVYGPGANEGKPKKIPYAKKDKEGNVFLTEGWKKRLATFEETRDKLKARIAGQALTEASPEGVRVVNPTPTPAAVGPAAPSAEATAVDEVLGAKAPPTPSAAGATTGAAAQAAAGGLPNPYGTKGKGKGPWKPNPNRDTAMLKERAKKMGVKGAKGIGKAAGVMRFLGPLAAVYGGYELLNTLKGGTVDEADERRIQAIRALGAVGGGMEQDMAMKEQIRGMQRMVDLAAIQRQQALDQMRNQYTGNQALDALVRGQQASLAALAQPSRPSIAEMMARM
jgi:hypothetical protein